MKKKLEVGNYVRKWENTELQTIKKKCEICRVLKLLNNLISFDILFQRKFNVLFF